MPDQQFCSKSTQRLELGATLVAPLGHMLPVRTGPLASHYTVCGLYALLSARVPTKLVEPTLSFVFYSYQAECSKQAGTSFFLDASKCEKGRIPTMGTWFG